MKKFLALFLLLTIPLCLFAGCKTEKKPNKQPESPKSSKELFHEFARGEITALDENGEAKYLDGGFADILSDKAYHCFIDMNGDGEDDLCIENPNSRLLVFTIKGGEVHHWYTAVPNGYYEEFLLLNNGAILFKEVTKSKDGVKYRYYELDEIGNEKIKKEFARYDSVYLSIEDKTIPEHFLIDGKEVSKEEYEEKTAKYFEIGSDKIVWYDKDGNKV